MHDIVNEAGVKREVKKLLTKHGWYYWMPSANAFGTSGIADFNAVRNGKFLAIETKFGSNKPTALQRRFLDSIAEHGGLAVVTTERTLGELEELLRLGGTYEPIRD